MIAINKQKQIEEVYNRALALEKNGNFTDAARFYTQLLALDKNDCTGAAVRLAAIGQGAIPKIAPPAYIATLFDQYADIFDMILVDILEYGVPDLLYAAVNKYYPDRIFKKLLDLGCGTGLVGEVFADISVHKSGVDLSQNMIEIAHE